MLLRNLEEYNGAYKDKTIFVIGSGTSIHSQSLEPLKDFVTIAVNSGILAFPADFFVSDDWSVCHWSYFTDLKSSDTTVLLYENKLKPLAHLFGDRSVMFKHRRGHHITDIYSHENYDDGLFETRTSVGTAIHIAHIMGAKKICVLGIDCCRMNDKRYFWQFWPPTKHPKRNDGKRVDGFKRVRRKDKQSDVDLVTILAYWKTQGKEINKKCSVYDASGGILDVFTHVKLDEFIDQNQEGRK